MARRRRNQRTLAQARADRKQLEKDIKREIRRANRQKLIDLREAVRRASRERKAAIASALVECRSARPETLKHARERIAREKKAARELCSRVKAQAKGKRSEVTRRRLELAAEAGFQRTMRRIERENRKREERQKRPGLASTRRSESDDEVEGNLPPELVYLWRRVKRQIRGSERKSRTEAFLEYAQEHPDEELAALEDRTDEVIRQLEARMANPKKKKNRKGKVAKKSRAKAKRKTNTARKMVAGAGGRSVGAALARERATVRRLRTELRERPKRTNPKRPPHAWWARCLSSVQAQKYARDPAAVCGAAWWKLPASQRRRIVLRLERSKKRRERRAAVAIAKAERNRASRAYRRRTGNPSDAQARADYERVHWGERGRGKVSHAAAANPAHGTATKLGKLVSVVYLTKKGGDRELTEYEHEFDGPLPTLAFHEGGLLIAGGGYSVKTGGITG